MTLLSNPSKAIPGENVKQKLHEALSNISNISECAILDYPDHINIGDHLIWLGDISYFLEERGVKVRYLSSSERFSPQELDKRIGKAPIILHGGGNFGDIWARAQAFREDIIRNYMDRPIYILPQTIFFSSAESLAKTAEVLNSHPNLTLFTRDHYSYEIALENFHNCQVLLAPDMAFQLVGKAEFQKQGRTSKGVFYMQRQDNESNSEINPKKLMIEQLTIGDWSSYEHNWIMGGARSNFKRFLGYLAREKGQRGLFTPKEYYNRQQWMKNSSLKKIINDASDYQLNLQSLSFIHSGIYQFSYYDAVITNRLHGHILCILMNIPHIFLPNSYYKNKGFYEAWTKDIEICRFVETFEQIEPALKELSCV